MKTQKHMGRGQLVERLAAQTGSKGMAIALLKKRGQMNDDGSLTAAGRARNQMTAAERAKSRAAKESGGSSHDYTYNRRTNAARKKG